MVLKVETEENITQKVVKMKPKKFKLLEKIKKRMIVEQKIK